MHAGRRVTAEVTLLVAIPGELQVAEIRHRAPRSVPDQRGATRRRFLPGLLAQLARTLCELDQRLDRDRLRRREPGQARRDRLERLAVADTRQRRRLHGAELRLR